jgi:hypothetical protein
MHENRKTTKTKKTTALVPYVHQAAVCGTSDPHLLLAGVDTIYFSFDTEVSDAMWNQLNEEQQIAKELHRQRHTAHCPDWLDARMCPTGAKGGYRFLLEHGDQWAIKLLRGVPNRPTIFVEMRAFALHTHAGGVVGVIEETLAYIRDVLLNDMDQDEAMQRINLDTARCSRLDLHADWQGGETPTYEETWEKHFLFPGRASHARLGEGQHCTGYTFGKKNLMARIYDKTIQAKKGHLDWYFELIRQRNGDAYNPELNIWRLEFQLIRDGVKGFKLYTKPRFSDSDETVEEELEAEDLPHIGSVRKALYWAGKVWEYLTTHWLKWVKPVEDTNHARWPVRATWIMLQESFAPVMAEEPMAEEQAQLVRAQRHSGYARVIHRLAVGIVTTLNVMDTDPAWAGVAWLKEVHRIAQLAGQKLEKRFDACDPRDMRAYKILKGMGVRPERYGEVEQLLKEALGVFTSAGVLALELPSGLNNVADLLLEVIDDLERIAREKGGIALLIEEKWRTRYKIATAHRLLCLSRHRQ